jgi:tRNA/tmRNA/rRNA uracil-C5-methylase (TrmA/RlmC/RlmD family)
MKITIEKIIYPGKSLGLSDGKIILTDEGIPGETVEVTPF